jgi:hypothetical protein
MGGSEQYLVNVRAKSTALIIYSFRKVGGAVDWKDITSSATSAISRKTSCGARNLFFSKCVPDR